jgi:hypothetical protein
MINLGNLGGLFNGGINPSAGTGSKVDLGALINAGIGLLNKKPSAGPVAVAKENDWVPVESNFWQKDFQVKNLILFVLIGAAIVFVVSQLGKNRMQSSINNSPERMKQIRRIKKQKAIARAEKAQAVEMKIAV